MNLKLPINRLAEMTDDEIDLLYRTMQKSQLGAESRCER